MISTTLERLQIKLAIVTYVYPCSFLALGKKKKTCKMC